MNRNELVTCSIASSSVIKEEFVIGPTGNQVRIGTEGFEYNGTKIEDAGRAYRTIMAVMHGKEPAAVDGLLVSKDAELDALTIELANVRAALATAEKMLEQANNPHTIWPRRTVRIEFTHPNVGDERFNPLLDVAMIELMEAGIDAAMRDYVEQSEADPYVFEATNGVQISVQGLEMRHAKPADQ